MSKRISIPTKPFSSWTPGDAELMSDRKKKSRKTMEISMQNLNYRELEKTKDKVPANKPPAASKSPKAKSSKIKVSKTVKKDTGGGKKRPSVTVKMKFNKK